VKGERDEVAFLPEVVVHILGEAADSRLTGDVLSACILHSAACYYS
jgi:hypothetical protein